MGSVPIAVKKNKLIDPEATVARVLFTPTFLACCFLCCFRAHPTGHLSGKNGPGKDAGPD